MTTRQLTAHYHRSQQQEPAPVLVLVGADGQDARAIHGSSRSATVHPSAFVLNGSRLVVVALWVDATDLCCLRDLMMMMIEGGR